MTVEVATLVARLLEIYLALGLVFAPFFAWRGAGRIDPVAEDATWGFRLLVIPGAVALWPLLLGRWLRGTERPVESNAHRRAAVSPSADVDEVSADTP